MEKPVRKQMRLKDFDYSFPTAYFVTICTHNRINLFGSISGQTAKLNQYGNIVEITWKNLNRYYPVELDEFVIMPNHFHGLLKIDSSEEKTQRPSLITILRTFKSMSTKRIHNLGNLSAVWQKSYYDTIIRDETHLNATREYIRNNPMNWELDKEYRK